jgi:hypothetical protein
MKILVFFFLFFIFFNTCSGQDSSVQSKWNFPHNSLYLEMGGNSLFWGSVNYERVFLNRQFYYLSGRLGVGYGTFLDLTMVTFPLIVSNVFQVYRSLAFEIGTGMTWAQVVNTYQDIYYDQYDWTYQSGPMLTGMAGIRLQSKKGFLFRADFSPLYDMYQLLEEDPKNNFLPMFGISFGYSFGR